MRIDFNISQAELGKFRTACEAVIRNVGTGTRAAVTEAGISIMSESLSQVPVDTGTLRDSAYLGVSRRDDVVGYRYGAVLGYGDPEGLAQHTGLNNKKTVRVNDPGGVVMRGGKVDTVVPPSSYNATIDAPMDWYIVPNNGVNPKNMMQASTYAGRVHEDLDMPHPNGGKAKFLEDPVRNWASGKFARTTMIYWKQAISYSNKGTLTKRYSNGAWKPVFSKVPRLESHTSFVKHSTGVQRGGQGVYKGESK